MPAIKFANKHAEERVLSSDCIMNVSVKRIASQQNWPNKHKQKSINMKIVGYDLFKLYRLLKCTYACSGVRIFNGIS